MALLASYWSCSMLQASLPHSAFDRIPATGACPRPRRLRDQWPENLVILLEPVRNAGASLVRPVDLHSGGCADEEFHAFRNLVDVNAHRDALCQPDPGKDRVDRRQPDLV